MGKPDSDKPLRFGALFFSFYRASWRHTLYALSLTLLTAILVFLSLALNRFYRTFFDALEARRIEELTTLVVIFLLILAALVLCTGVHLIIKRRWQLRWRIFLAEALLERWLTRGHHHRLRHLAQAADNPDARIAEDIRIATEVAVELYHSLLFSLLSVVAFAEVLGAITKDLPFGPPGMMLMLALGYAVLGGAIGWLLGIPLTRATHRVQESEANFRYRLTRCRNQAEAIALAQGEAFERLRARERLALLAREWHRQSLAYLGIVSYSTGYGTLLPFFPLLVLAFPYAAGMISLGLLMQAAQAFERLTAALSWPVHNQGEIARCRTSLERIAKLWDDLAQLEAEDQRCSAERICLLQDGETNALRIEHLTLLSAQGEVLVRDFSAQADLGRWQRWQLPEAGTAPLLKALAGLWPWGRGVVRFPADHAGIAFLPARPYLPEGTLEAALIYPHDPAAIEQRRIKQLLSEAGLGAYADKLGDCDDWNRNLPLDKQRLLALVRVALMPRPWIMIEALANDEAFIALAHTLLLRHAAASGVVLLVPLRLTPTAIQAA